MILSRESPIEFVRSWRRREGYSQRDLAAALGIGRARVGEFETGLYVGIAFCIRFMAVLSDKEKLLLLDVLTEHLALFKTSNARIQDEAISALRKRGRLHELTDDDVYITKLNGYRIDGGYRLKKPVCKRRKKKGRSL